VVEGARQRRVGAPSRLYRRGGFPNPPERNPRQVPCPVRSIVVTIAYSDAARCQSLSDPISIGNRRIPRALATIAPRGC